MKYQDFSSDENLVSSEDTIFVFHTVKISLPDFFTLEDKIRIHVRACIYPLYICLYDKGHQDHLDSNNVEVELNGLLGYEDSTNTITGS